MKIGIDATCWGNKRGFGRFTRELLKSLLELDKTNEYLFFLDSNSDELETIPENAKKIIVKTNASAIEAASSEGRRSLRDILAMSREVWRHKIDLFYFPTVYSYFPIFNRTKIIVTVHDMIADHHPELVFSNSKLKFFWKLKQYTAIRQADLIATVSEYSSRQIRAYFKLDKSHFRIITEAARPVFKVLPQDKERSKTLARYNLNNDEKFLLCVGGISPHKNLSALVEAFNLIKTDKDCSAVKLVFVGDYKDDPFLSAYPRLKEQIAKLNLEKNVVFTGFISDKDLANLYNTAALLVFPSLEEGFGLPAIEAMACGTPVAASKRGSLPEVLENAGRFFDPSNVNEMAKVIKRVLLNNTERRQMSEIGLKRAQEFSWENAAQATLDIFEKIVMMPPKKEIHTPKMLLNSK